VPRPDPRRCRRCRPSTGPRFQQLDAARLIGTDPTVARYAAPSAV
jgi:hypothetical protein